LKKLYQSKSGYTAATLPAGYNVSSFVDDHATRTINRCFISALLLLALIELLAGHGGWLAPHRLLHFNPNAYSPFFAFAVGSVFACQAILCGRNAALFAASLIGLILFSLHCLLFRPADMGITELFGLIAYYLGTGSILLLTWQALRHQSKNAWPALQLGLLPVLFVVLSWSYLEATPFLHARTLDPLLLHFDGSLGGQPSLWAARLSQETAWLLTLCKLTYTTLPLWLGALGAIQYRRSGTCTLMSAFVIAGLLGSALYYFFPAAGPRYLLGADFPFTVPELPPEPATIAPAFLNAMPSLHMAWAVLLWINVRAYSVRLNIAYGLFCLLTVFATLGLGEHYLIDLVVAFPLALLAQQLAERRYRERRTLLSGMLLMAWLVYLRANSQGLSSVGLWHWLPVIATLAFCLRPRKPFAN
jgi:hypothetical protein